MCQAVFNDPIPVQAPKPANNLEPGWLARQAEQIRQEYVQLPLWQRRYFPEPNWDWRAAEIEYHQRRIRELKAEISAASDKSQPPAEAER